MLRMIDPRGLLKPSLTLTNLHAIISTSPTSRRSSCILLRSPSPQTSALLRQISSCLRGCCIRRKSEDHGGPMCSSSRAIPIL